MDHCVYNDWTRTEIKKKKKKETEFHFCCHFIFWFEAVGFAMTLEWTIFTMDPIRSVESNKYKKNEMKLNKMHIAELPSSLISSEYFTLILFYMAYAFGGGQIFMRMESLEFHNQIIHIFMWNFVDSSIEMHLYVTNWKRKNICSIVCSTNVCATEENVRFIRTIHWHCFGVNEPEKWNER